MPNEQKEIFKDKMQNIPPQKTQQPTISFEYTQPTQPVKKEFIGNKPFDIYSYASYARPNLPSLTYNPYDSYNAYTSYNPYYNPNPNPNGFMPNGVVPPVIIKNYSITGNNITGNQQQMSIIYEDILPKRGGLTPGYTTLGERIGDYHFIRSSIFSNFDGEDIDLQELKPNSLSNRIKIDVCDINPYNSYKYSSNPYHGLPKNFLLYRSGYPIRHNEKTGHIECAKDSLSINVRLYKMLEGAWFVNLRSVDKKTDQKYFFDYDEWREVAFYEYIRENILKKKVSPNFVNMYGYFISENSMIDYDTIHSTNINNQTKTETETKIEDQYIAHPTHLSINPDEQHPILQLLQPQPIEPTEHEKMSMNQDLADEHNDKIKFAIANNSNKYIYKQNPYAYLGKSMVMLTESPTYSIFGWASKVYLQNGNIFEMVGRGYHNEDVWLNVLFQLMTALYVMQIHEIFISNFDIEKNVFIKDLNFRGTATEYWKYKINGIDYYVPNLGYLVLIDSNFGDITHNNTDNKFGTVQKYHKLNGKFYKESNQNLKSNIFNMLIKAFDPNVFGRYTQNYGIVSPPGEIIKLMEDIHSTAIKDQNQNIEPYLLNFMAKKKFLNNRIGTYLKTTEISNIGNEYISQQKGDIVVYKEQNNTHKFVLYLGLDNNNRDAIIITTPKKNMEIYEEKIVPMQSLSNYVGIESIQQIYKPNEENFIDKGLLETYIINEQ